MWSEHRFISFDETPIFYRLFTPSEAPKGVLVILHGMGEHSGRYRHAAEYWGGLGFESYIPDVRGYGLSGGRRGFVRNFSDFHRDLKALHDHIGRQRKELPIFFVGHSFGGLLASSYLALQEQPSVKGLVLSSPFFGIALPVPYWRHALGVLFSYALPGYSQPSGVKPAMLTHDPEILTEYKKDALIYHKVSASLYREITSMIRRKNDIARTLSLPVLLLQAGDDKVVSRQEAVSFYDGLGSQDKELEVYEGFYHEILNEIDREKVFSRIGTWLLKHLHSN